jgi:uncharacterized membrane protein YccC
MGAKRAGWTVGRLLLTLGATAGGVAILIVGTGTGFAAWAAATGLLLVGVGALTNRPWVALVPIAVAVAWSVTLAIANAGDDAYSDPPWEYFAVLALTAGGVFAGLLLAGVGARRAARQAKRDETARRHR